MDNLFVMLHQKNIEIDRIAPFSKWKETKIRSFLISCNFVPIFVTHWLRPLQLTLYLYCCYTQSKILKFFIRKTIWFMQHFWFPHHNLKWKTEQSNASLTNSYAPINLWTISWCNASMNNWISANWPIYSIN